MKARLRIDASLREVIEKCPSVALPLRARLQRLQGRDEPEMRLLPWLVPRERLAVDVGANKGVYTWELTKLAERVLAVEANSAYIPYLSRIRPAQVRVIHAALSSQPGEAVLRVPTNGPFSGGLGTIEPACSEDGAQWASSRVPMRTLAEIACDESVGFIKVDVEGHELAVLQGAAEVLQRDKPRLLVEAENRHRPDAVESLVEYLRAFGYRGLMLVDGQLEAVEGFRPEIHQSISTDATSLEHGRRPRTYINNFVFLPM